ncbi:TPA: hypothetical protein ACV5NF_005617 [Pseudomonas aeruginosa]|uniref:Uncharacterized protein n=1 Tax=Pseudomonas phage vB_Pae_LC3I3 TaxID=2961988 RepID=A0A976SUS5_9CAUD|nr:hypothetical protein [Pseudomonas aeruginosa]YP_010773391.1 hypothetical protein QIT85_gp01 [Pseudomonas phage vB_Pae_LC3I3]HEM8800126.1 hypothetical protein [Klebsiella michiganensis]ALY80996.1 hypothetical protein HW03_30525 [Pseudomonas aeruginosa]EIU5418128.1 hypothetical protein [Pseudomonas aeruginosa]EKU3990854.1 hypothetical protein [Pseudomonas aeruginosa]ERV29418.1 hypothetical protein Q070_02389 [Pseudomonas aeruginosa BL16]
MPKYEVIKPWNGVSKGQVLELESLAAALLPNVREVGALRSGSLTLDVSAQVDEAARQALAEARVSVDAMIDEAKAQAGTLTPAIPDGSERRELIKARLKELKIEFDGRQGEEALAALLPEGELVKLFPAK